MTTIGLAAELDVVFGETKIEEYATLLNKWLDIPGIGESIEQAIFEKGLAFAETIGEHNLPHLIEVADALAAKFNKGPFRLRAYSK